MTMRRRQVHRRLAITVTCRRVGASVEEDAHALMISRERCPVDRASPARVDKVRVSMDSYEAAQHVLMAHACCDSERRTLNRLLALRGVTPRRARAGVEARESMGRKHRCADAPRVWSWTLW